MAEYLIFLEAGIEARVQALFRHPAVFQSAFSGWIDRVDVSPTQSKFSTQRSTLLVLLAIDHHTHNPTPRTGWINNLLEACSIAMPPRAKILHQLLCKFASKCHQKNITFQTTKE